MGPDKVARSVSSVINTSGEDSSTVQLHFLAGHGFPGDIAAHATACLGLSLFMNCFTAKLSSIQHENKTEGFPNRSLGLGRFLTNGNFGNTIIVRGRNELAPL